MWSLATLVASRARVVATRRTRKGMMAATWSRTFVPIANIRKKESGEATAKAVLAGTTGEENKADGDGDQVAGWGVGSTLKPGETKATTVKKTRL
jgi:hypothetical protein